MGLIGTRRALLGGGGLPGGLLVWDAADLLASTKTKGANGEALTLTPAMAKRAVTVPAGGSLVAPLIQGKLDGTAGDAISYSRGTLYGSNLFDTFDCNQYTIAFWYRPEFAGNDSLNHYLWWGDTGLFLLKNSANVLLLGNFGTSYTGPAVSWAAGAPVHICVSLATKRAIDGTNYVRVSVNNAHTYTGTGVPTADFPSSTHYLGCSNTGVYQASGLISDFHIFRRVLTDGDNLRAAPEGANTDEIAALYAAGAGAPASTVIVDYGESCVFGFPTNGVAEALTASDADEAIYAPLRADNKLVDWHCQTTYASSAWTTLGTPAVGPADATVSLGKNLFDAGKGTFDAPGTESWSAFAPNTIEAEDQGAGNYALKVTRVSGTSGATLALRDSTDLSADLITGAWYRISYKAKVSAGASVTYQLYNGAAYVFTAVTSTTFVTKTVDFMKGAGIPSLSIVNMDAGEIAYLDDITLQRLTYPRFGTQMYEFDPDADDEGIAQSFVVVAGQDYMVSAHIGDSGDYAAELEIYDVTNSAVILSRLTDASGDVDNLDCCFEVPAGCIEVSVRVKSTNAGQGAITVHQMTVYSNLWDDGGFETGTAPTDVGSPTTSAQSATVAHSGTNSWKVIADAVNEGIKRAITTTAGKFYMASGWVYAATAGTVDLTVGTKTVTSAGNDAWKRLTTVFLAAAASTDVNFLSNAAQTFHVDDVEAHELDPVTLTCTPANEAASRESMTLTPWGTASTIRVDGRDVLSLPTANNLVAAEGTLAMWVKFRHATAWADECLFFTSITSPNAFALYRIAATNVLSAFYGNLSDASTATIADTSWHHVVFTWRAGTCYLYIDTVLAAGFAIAGATAPTLGATLYLGSNGTPALDADAAFLGLELGKRQIVQSEVTKLFNLTRAWTLGDV